MFEVGISPRQFALFRLVFGGYLALHFAQLVPHGPELFGPRGVLPDAGLNPLPAVLPNPFLAPLGDGTIRLLLSGLALLSLLFAAGVWRRTTALLLWWGWACLFHRNNLIANPSLPYVGLLLLLTTLVPLGEGQCLRRPRDPAWRFPSAVYWALWIPLAAGYTYSGLHKLGSPSWLHGDALRLLADNPLARPGPVRDLLLSLPDPVAALLTWTALAGEILFLPLSCWRGGRALAWSWLVGMHLGILSVVSFADLTAGMLLAHWFVFDPAWRRPALRSHFRGPDTPSARPHSPAAPPRFRSARCGPPPGRRRAGPA